MNLQLLITKREIKHYNTKTKIQYRFAVIDPDKSKQYPTNFVCMLPRTIKPKAKQQNKFVKTYGNKSLELAKQLLNQALKTEDDPDARNKIRERLRLLAPKQKYLVKCKVCGKEFKARRYGYRFQKTCYRCLNQSRSSQT